jgi:glycosyltransferase involved in cell wall biosynthesis
MRKNYKILMVCPQFSPLVGGYERAAERLSVELARTGHQVDIIAERRLKIWPKSELRGGTTVRRLWCIYRPGLHLITALVSYFAFLLFNAWRYQIIHIHQYGYHAALAIFFAKLFRRPVLLKLTSTGDQGVSKVLARFHGICRWLLIYLHRRVDACIVTSEEARKEALLFGIPEQRVALIGNGVDIVEFAPLSPAEKSNKKNQLQISAEQIVLYVGRMSPEKNALGLLEAWGRINSTFSNAILIYIGDGLEYELLQRRIAELNCEKSVLLMGNRSDVSSWYKIADIHVLPSWREGLSNTLLEAMSCQLPIVSTRVSGSIDIFARADVGQLVDVGDIEGLAMGVNCLLLDRDRRLKCGKEARQIIEELYSLKSIAQATSQIYNKLLVSAKAISPS